jgi:glycosyltransferase involved in cell wall biosynthesis
LICGLAVVVSNRCGCCDDLVAHNENGYIFNPEDYRELSSYLQIFLENEVKAKEMGKISSEKIKDATPENSAKMIVEGIKLFF